MAARLDLTYSTHQLAVFHGPQVRKFNAVAKGRRFGITNGAAHAAMEWANAGDPVLWGDTVSTNIAKYVARYFEPRLKGSGIPWKWRKSEKVLHVGRGLVDFRSADRPENWEGFGYRRIVLNEAGLILQNPDLYSRTVLPMMIDYPDSQLWAVGVPKGMRLKDGRPHPFYTLHELGRTTSPRHQAWTFSSYQSPFLDADSVAELEREIANLDPLAVRQEIFGEFIDRTTDAPFAFAFDKGRHVKPCSLARGLATVVSVDFNVDPFCAIVCQVHGAGRFAKFTTVAEIVVRGGGIREMADRIRHLVPNTGLMELTGDRTGANSRLERTGVGDLFDALARELNIPARQIRMAPNPSHLESREQCNYVLAHHPGLAIAPECVGLIADLQLVEIDPSGKLKKADRSKASQRADLLDTWRYVVNTYLWGWIDKDRHGLHTTTR